LVYSFFNYENARSKKQNTICLFQVSGYLPSMYTELQKFAVAMEALIQNETNSVSLNETNDYLIQVLSKQKIVQFKNKYDLRSRTPPLDSLCAACSERVIQYSEVLIDKLTFDQLIQESSPLHETPKFIVVFIRTRHKANLVQSKKYPNVQRAPPKRDGDHDSRGFENLKKKYPCLYFWN